MANSFKVRFLGGLMVTKNTFWFSTNGCKCEGVISVPLESLNGMSNMTVFEHVSHLIATPPTRIIGGASVAGRNFKMIKCF